MLFCCCGSDPWLLPSFAGILGTFEQFLTVDFYQRLAIVSSPKALSWNFACVPHTVWLTVWGVKLGVYCLQHPKGMGLLLDRHTASAKWL